MHSESQIRKAVKILLEAYSQLNTSEVKEHLYEVLDFDEDDLTLSSTRHGETLIMQRIGNIVSHQSKQITYYSEGFLVDKGASPAIWMATDANGLVANQEETNYRREGLNTYNPNRYKKINWDEVNERNSTLGMAGEQFVYQNEIDRIMQINPLLVDRIQHLSAMQGDGFGYDVLSIDDEGNTIFLEVKTTKSPNPDTPFYMSINEYNFFKKNQNSNNAFIVRVYNFDINSRFGDFIFISAEELSNNYRFDPISYKVTKV